MTPEEAGVDLNNPLWVLNHIIGWGDICYGDPDLPQCADVPSFYGYRISLPANATFLALFSLSFVGYVAVYAVTRRGLAFTVAMLLGVLCEIIGYVGRILSYKNQWDENGFLIQICCLTIGPAFMAGGIYLTLRRIVYAFGQENSRIPPEYYTRIATGGGMASVASHQNRSVTTGDNIMIAGLSFQVFTMLVFLVCAADFFVNTWRRRARLGAEQAFAQDESSRAVRGSLMFRAFLAALAVASVCIFWRCVFRVAELSRGWSGPLMKRQDLFIGFEGVMVVTACLLLNVFHPSICFRAMMEGQGGLRSKRKAKKSALVESDESLSGK